MRRLLAFIAILLVFFSTLTHSSLLKIDPTRILHAVSQYSGLVLSKEIEDHFQNVKRVSHCDSAYLDVYNRELEIINYMVYEKNSKYPALRVGRILLKWDSYSKPCLQVELEDVDVLVEFVNVFLTRTNWHELGDGGFPPKMEESASDSTDSFLRVGSMELSGAIRLKLRSRPLDEDLLPDVAFNSVQLRGLSRRIRRLARKNQKRRGLTTDAMYEVVESYVREKFHGLLAGNALDFVAAGLDPDRSEALRTAKAFFGRAKDAARDYAEAVAVQTEVDLQKVLMGYAKDVEEKVKLDVEEKVKQAKKVFEKAKETARDYADTVINPKESHLTDVLNDFTKDVEEKVNTFLWTAEDKVKNVTYMATTAVTEILDKLNEKDIWDGTGKDKTQDKHSCAIKNWLERSSGVVLDHVLQMLNDNLKTGR